MSPAEPTHTPGPWRLGQSGLNIHAGSPDPEGGLPHGRIIASTSPGRSLPVRVANARLIAACPDLLECLMAYVEIEPRIVELATSSLRERAQAAIASARGGET